MFLSIFGRCGAIFEVQNRKNFEFFSGIDLEGLERILNRKYREPKNHGTLRGAKAPSVFFSHSMIHQLVTTKERTNKAIYRHSVYLSYLVPEISGTARHSALPCRAKCV